MYFLAPLYLAGLLAGAIPIFLHLYSNRQAKTVDFSSLRLIKLSLETKARWFWLQDVLLLALRVLIFALLPLALAKPALKTTGGQAPMLARPETSAVLIIDNSFSMGATSEGATAFERAKAGARDVLRTFRTGDKVALYLINAGMESVYPTFTTDLSAVADSLENLPLSHHNTRPTGVFAKCLELLSEAKTTNKEIYIFSDFQASGWRLEQETTIAAPKEITTYLIDCGRDGVGNVALKSLHVDAGPKVTNRSIRIEAELHNHGGATETIATLFVKQLGTQPKAGSKPEPEEEKPKAQRQIKLDAGKTEVVSFEYTFPQIGRYEIRVALQPDALPADDTRYFVVSISEQVRALAVGGEKGLGALSDTFYLSLALKPQTSNDPKKWAGIVLASTRVSAMLDRPLGIHDVVFVCNIPAFSDAQVQALEDYVALGGSLVIFLGDASQLDAYNAKLFSTMDDKPGLLPAKILAPLKNPQREKGRSVSLSEVDEKHPLFAGLSDRAHQALFSLKFSRYAPLDLSGSKGGKITAIAKLEDGTPMILEKELGRGRILFFNTAADRGYGTRAGAEMGWSNLVTSPIFPVLMHKTLDYLTAPRESSRDLLVGESVPFLFPLEPTKTPAPLKIARPDDKTDTLIPRPEAGFLRASYIVDAAPGVYRAERDREKPKDVKDLKSATESKPLYFVANMDTGESNLMRVPAKDVGAKISGGSLVLIANNDELVAKVTRTREGLRLWPIVMAIILVFLAAESLLSNRFAAPAKKKGKPRIGRAAEAVAVILLLFAVVANAEPPQLAPKNLVPNGDFETGSDKMPAKWDHPAQWKDAHEGLVTNESRQGDSKGGKCVRFHVTKPVGENEGLQIFSDFFPVPDGGGYDAVYRFKFDAKKTGTGIITWVDFWGKDQDGKPVKIYRRQVRAYVGEDWQTVESTFKIHIRAGQIRLKPWMKPEKIQIELMGVYAGGEAWFDNISLELLPPNTKVEEPRLPDAEPLFPGGKKPK